MCNNTWYETERSEIKQKSEVNVTFYLNSKLSNFELSNTAVCAERAVALRCYLSDLTICYKEFISDT